jgi:very-short-patch-repair endonuclease
MEATLPEVKVHQALTKLGISFEFQSTKMGGTQVKGGAVVDFYIPSLRLVISVIGTYWHSDPDRRVQDSLQRTMLASQGITTIYITEEMALRNALYYVQEALRGVDHSGFGRLL